MPPVRAPPTAAEAGAAAGSAAAGSAAAVTLPEAVARYERRVEVQRLSVAMVAPLLAFLAVFVVLSMMI